MAGHSHWAKIKRKKGVTDARRGRLWSKLARNIIVAAKAGGGKPEDNLALRYAIEKAKAANMPRDTIENAIKKGTGELGAVHYETVFYEGYGAGGVAILCEALTDNRNRTAPEVRKIFERAGGNVGSAGSVQWMFQPKGQVLVPIKAADEDTIAAIALEAGADDYVNSGDVWEIICEPAGFEPLRAALAAAQIEVQSAELTRVPTTTVPVDAETGRKVLALVDALEDHDDIQNVFTNFELPEDMMASMSAG
ncbi:MAG: YebC/PmpR family DNA-binding transcriptional regulator [Phycisphaerae bacterium]|jgi:YebC/PmpR family DNA-binding regulatory protein